MKRLYFLAPSLGEIQAALKDLKATGISKKRISVWSHDELGLARRHIPGLNPFAQLDIIHAGEQGVLWGLVAGCVVGLLMLLIQPFPVNIGVGAFFAVWILCTLFGSWVGGLVGIGSDHYQLAPFHEQVEKGMHLLIMDVKRDEAGQLRDHIARLHPLLRFAGESECWNNPFKGLHHVASSQLNER